MKTLGEVAAPAPVVRKLLERDIQKQCVDWARDRGYWARKFSSMTQNSVPDYLFAREWRRPEHLPSRLLFATEFKRPGNKSTDAQLEEQKAMHAAGWVVFECSSVAEFKKIVLTLESTA